ncbi:MAG: hypothetical protein A2Y82_02445 [Candidatus Buchananbacteria bacterium RBG_13_36_9]|uniref:Dodecin n=1 Tax=Candidatus Buchananbacteria bacterium RBG_13_36_9 TaxID=1797530 RepID=A0A1G1XQT6_9BACT|nr:MAG: hypothetical protein A2Y82_02445 [Candidatus Buchananbacteria bacterium RBG_13_36_9]
MCIKIIELIGTSKKNFEDAAQDAVNTAAKTLRGITGVDVLGQTAVVENNRIVEYRVNVKIAFKIE